MASAVSAPVFFQPVKHPTDQAVNLLNANIKTAFDAVGLLLAEYVKVKDLVANPSPSILGVTATAGAGAAATATLPAVPGQYHYITSITLMRNATAALAGTATLVHISTNLPGALAWSVGNAMAAGGTQLDLSLAPASPIRSLAAGVATTITMPAPGAAVLNRIVVTYYTAK
ncbi:MAG: hypothetical protein ABJA82_00615 [Myxococcales bacterium]